MHPTYDPETSAAYISLVAEVPALTRSTYSLNEFVTASDLQIVLCLDDHQYSDNSNHSEVFSYAVPELV